ncbi:MAG: SGNH/GDSL hydrolase family protein [Clostridia bacterium]|nr:SGNH/GDSL hydrolase family protein [Clostridia bacterium]
MELKNKKILFLGDSITAGHGTSGKEYWFTSLISKRYGSLCVNYGIGGTRIARQEKPSEYPEHDLDFPGRIEGMDREADIVCVFGGTNDFGHGDAPIGKMSDRTVFTFYGALHILFNDLIERYPSALIFVITPLHRLGEDNPRGNGSKEKDVAVLREYVDIIRRVAEYYSLPVLDLYATSGLQPAVKAIREKYIPDGLHPNDEGHRVIADRIGGFLSSI